jgi:hypothetical protein
MLSNNGEFKWIPRPTSEQDLDRWRPNPEDVTTFDHLYTTKYGNFDVVPEIAGTFEALSQRATQNEVEGIEVLVTHIDDLLSRLTTLRREKDIERVEALRSIQMQRGKMQPN